MNYNNVTLKRQPAIFRNGALAASYAARSVKPHRVVLGNAGEYLVVTNGDAMRLVRAGYELL